MLVAGVDSSTQSTKVLLCRADDGEVVDSGSAPHPAGTECDPQAWWVALRQAGDGLLDRAAAVGVAGQQHGMIALDESGQVIRPAGDRYETLCWLTAELDQVLGLDCPEAGVCLRQGNPARELAAAAREHHADALVLGAYCSWWHGAARSFPDRLARHAACPVTMVP